MVWMEIDIAVRWKITEVAQMSPAFTNDLTSYLPFKGRQGVVVVGVPAHRDEPTVTNRFRRAPSARFPATQIAVTRHSLGSQAFHQTAANEQHYDSEPQCRRDGSGL